MSDKSASSPNNIISLPKSGGALSGLGDKFSPDLFTGTGNYSVPIALPKGRNGFEPMLSLNYSTGNGNGIFGLGWGITVPNIMRKTSQGIPKYDENDVFIISGAEDLVEVIKDGNKTYYKPRTEGLFAKIIRIKDKDNDYWEVWTKDGLISYYGKPEEGKTLAVISKPNYPSSIFSWKITKTVDTFGNVIEYDYEYNKSDNQLYLKEIKYIDYQDENNKKFLISIIIDYKNDNNKEVRPDPFSDYRASFEIRTTKRCNKISIVLHQNEDDDKLIKYYKLIYKNDSYSNISLLESIRLIGVNGEETELMPKLFFGYSEFDINKRNLIAIKGESLPSLTLASPQYELVDLFGSGLPDILEMSTNVVRYWRNLGDGKFSLPRNMTSAPGGIELGGKGVQLIDGNGDGKADLMVNYDNGLSGYYPLKFNGNWDSKSFIKYKYKPTFDFKDPETKLIDLTGDGITDALKTSSRFECYFNDKDQGWKDIKLVQRQDEEYFPNVVFSDNRVKVGDMSGDGLQDILLIHNGSVEYWPNLGYGNWGKRIHMKNSPKFPYGYDIKRVLIGDLDGDGLSDIVYVDNTKVTLWINQSGNSWSNPITILGTPPINDTDSVRIVDLLGNGVGGILWSLENSFSLRSNMYFLDCIGGDKPYLINEINNNIGSITKITYASSTKYYLMDERKKQTRWKTPLPFPVQVVKKVEVSDEISGGKLSTEYSYHHGYYDGAEREFRGFGRVDHRDTEVIQNEYFSPPLETRTWFHQGPIGDEFGEWYETDYSNEYWQEDKQVLKRPQEMVNFLKSLSTRKARRDALRTLRGMTIRSEVYALDRSELENRPYTVTEVLNGVKSIDLDGKNIFFSISLAQRVSQYERGNEPMTQFIFADKYDEYGQVLSKINVAVARDSTKYQDYIISYEEYDYGKSINQEKYIVDRKCSSASFEIINDGTFAIDNKENDVFTMYVNLYNKIINKTINKNVLQKVINYYDGEGFIGLEYGKIGDYGASVRIETLAFNSKTLKEVYNSVNPIEKVPVYLIEDNEGSPLWDEYSEEFKNTLLPLAGYIHHNEGGAPNYEEGFYILSNRSKYDFQENSNNVGRGLLKSTMDPLNNVTSISYDEFELLPIEVEDAANLKTKVKYDYRVLQPKEVEDANGNRQSFTFTPLGFLKEIYILGKVGEEVGDIEQTEANSGVPSSRMEYNFLSYQTVGTPISVTTTQRVYHKKENGNDEVIKAIEFSDGFGRVVQKRLQGDDVIFTNNTDITFGSSGLPTSQSAEILNAVGIKNANIDNPYVVVSGWQIYDNKGRVVEKYEPFFDTGYDYKKPLAYQYGQKVKMYYDPRGNLIKTKNPDNSEQVIILGIPYDIENPNKFIPTPWEVYEYDSNDNGGRTHYGIETSYENHFNTPTSSTIDPLGRKIEVIQRNGKNEEDKYKISNKYDIQGNVIEVKDQLDRIVATTIYDLNKNPMKVYMMDAGAKIVLSNSANKIIEQRDSKEALQVFNYDMLLRNTKMWARNNKDDEITLRIKNIYGDNIDRNIAKSLNLLGKLYKQYDEAGIVTFEKYDFKGNMLEKNREVISDDTVVSMVEDRKYFKVDWDKDEVELDENIFRTSYKYDALNRTVTLTYPETSKAQNKVRRVLDVKYSKAGTLQKVYLDNKEYVERISYNAKGDRILIAYGNNVMTRYAYDDESFRLVRIRTESYTKTSENIYEPKPERGLYQDYGYEYDLIGNILKINDKTPNSGTNLSVDKDNFLREFKYDPIYRLLSATGREYVSSTSSIPYKDVPWFDRPTNSIINGDLSNIFGYKETYLYDKLGNILDLNHDSTVNGYNRSFEIKENSNKLNSLKINNNTPYSYDYDLCGNLIKENASRKFTWDYMNRLVSFIVQGSESEESISKEAYYLYDAAGERVKKVILNQSGLSKSTVYIDGIFEEENFKEFQDSGSEIFTNYTLRIMDNMKNIALERIGKLQQGDNEPLIQYEINDHIGSCNVVLNEYGELVDREEYTPYGESTLRTLGFKKYRFSGKEKDNESGLYYFGARYYAPWMCKWISTDPTGMVDGPNLYGYVRNNPTIFSDIKGRESALLQENQCKSVMVKPEEYNQFSNIDMSQSSDIGEVKTGKQVVKGVEFEIQTVGADMDINQAKEANRKGLGLYSKGQLKRGVRRTIAAKTLHNISLAGSSAKLTKEERKGLKGSTGQGGYIYGDNIFVTTHGDWTSNTGGYENMAEAVGHEFGHSIHLSIGYTSMKEIRERFDELNKYNFNKRELQIYKKLEDAYTQVSQLYYEYARKDRLEISGRSSLTQEQEKKIDRYLTEEMNIRMHDIRLLSGGEMFFDLYLRKSYNESIHLENHYKK